MAYPKSIKVEDWETYLGRNLNKKEKKILEDAKRERYMNALIKKLVINSVDRRLIVAHLTEPYGDCMFESLNYFGIGTDVMTLRNGVAIIMDRFADHKDFIPGTDLTLREQFEMVNEMEYAMTKGDDFIKCTRYNYKIMCCDLGNECSWKNLPTELILRVISYLYRVNICIATSSSSYIHQINSHTDPDAPQIFLGHLGEYHYVPLIEGEIGDNKMYRDGIDKFRRWVIAVDPPHQVAY